MSEVQQVETKMKVVASKQLDVEVKKELEQKDKSIASVLDDQNENS